MIIVLVAVIALMAFTLFAVVVISVVLLGEDLYKIVSETISAGVTLFEQFASSLWTFMQDLGQDLATLADQLLRIGIYLAIPCATIALIIKNNFYYGLVNGALAPYLKLLLASFVGDLDRPTVLAVELKPRELLRPM